jgi:hypothetical protein
MPTETKQQTLAELERLEKEATPGPWAYGPGEFHGGKRFEYVVGPRDVMVKFKAKPADLIAIVNGVGPLCEGNNADFIVALRNHALPLLREQGDEIERLRGELEINEAADRRTEALIIAAANLYAVEFNQSLDTFGEALRDLYGVVRNETATIDRLIENDNRRAIRALGGE